MAPRLPRARGTRLLRTRRSSKSPPRRLERRRHPRCHDGERTRTTAGVPCRSSRQLARHRSGEWRLPPRLATCHIASRTGMSPLGVRDGRVTTAGGVLSTDTAARTSQRGRRYRVLRRRSRHDRTRSRDPRGVAPIREQVDTTSWPTSCSPSCRSCPSRASFWSDGRAPARSVAARAPRLAYRRRPRHAWRRRRPAVVRGAIRAEIRRPAPAPRGRGRHPPRLGTRHHARTRPGSTLPRSWRCPISSPPATVPLRAGARMTRMRELVGRGSRPARGCHRTDGAAAARPGGADRARRATCA